MSYGRKLQGTPVFWKNRFIGTVEDISADPVTGAVYGFLIRTDPYFEKYRFVTLANVEKLKPFLVIRPDAGFSSFSPHRVTGDGLRAACVLDEKGREIGTICDYYLHQNRLAGVELSGGLIADVLQGRSFIPWEHLQNTFTVVQKNKLTEQGD